MYKPEVTLTTMLHDAVKTDNKKWNKDHVKAFFRTRLEKPLNDASAIAVLSRVGDLDGMALQKINGKNHVSTAISRDAKAALNKFLYGARK